MKITIVTLFRAGLSEHYVAAVKGTIKKKDRLKLAERLDLLPDDDESDELSFCEYKLVDNVDDLEHIPDIDTSGCITC